MTSRRVVPTLLGVSLVLVLAACGQRVESTAPGTVAVPEAPAPAQARPRGQPPAAAPEASGQEASPVEPAPATPAGGPATQGAAATTARVISRTGWSPFARVGELVLHHPAAQVERIGFHESNHAGARDLEVLAGATAPVTLDSRDRGTGRRSAADVVVAPGGEVRAPVTGTVLRAGTYVLYCDHTDDYVVISPDVRPDWEVKVLHIDGVRVAAGDRVEAGITPLAPRPTPLPFASQVDEHTAEPSWPHVHLEVVDPSIPNPPSDGGC